jgi:DNA-binding HxlR family transcriptional regulator
LLAASQCLSVFTNALNCRVLYALAGGPLSPGELGEELPWAPQSSLRRSLAGMTEMDVVTRRTEDERASPGEIELTEAGRELLPVAAALQRWLEDCPGGPVGLEDTAAQGVVRVLTAGWDSTVVRALAEDPRGLVELSAAIRELNYPALKRRLTKLRSTGLAVPVDTERGPAFEASEWLRRAVVPLTLAGRWERRHQAGGQPISAMEIEAAFLLALPLVRLPAKATGICALAVLTSSVGNAKRSVAGVVVDVRAGEIVSREAGVTGKRPTWALGTIDAWLEALVDGRTDGLRMSGAKPGLAKSVVEALHDDVFRDYEEPSAQAKPTKASK